MEQGKKRELLHHQFARLLAASVGEVGIGRGVLVDGSPRARKRARGYRAGEDESLDLQPFGLFEDVARAVDVGVKVLWAVLVGEVIVGREMQHVVGATLLLDLLRDALDVRRAADVHLDPLDVAVVGHAGFAARAACDRIDHEMLLGRLQERAPDEARGAGDDQGRQPPRHRLVACADAGARPRRASRRRRAPRPALTRERLPGASWRRGREPRRSWRSA